MTLYEQLKANKKRNSELENSELYKDLRLITEVIKRIPELVEVLCQVDWEIRNYRLDWKDMLFENIARSGTVSVDRLQEVFQSNIHDLVEKRREFKSELKRLFCDKGGFSTDNVIINDTTITLKI